MKFERNIEGKRGRELTALIAEDRLRILREAVEYLGDDSAIRPFLPLNSSAKKNTAHIDRRHVKELSVALKTSQEKYNEENPPRLIPIDPSLMGEAAEEAREAASEAMREQARRGVEVGFYASLITLEAALFVKPIRGGNESVDPAVSQLFDGLMVPDYIPEEFLTGSAERASEVPELIEA